MAKVKARLSESIVHCSKPGCATGVTSIQRHHVRHQAMWLGIWAGRRAGEKRFTEFVERYHRFDPKDWVYLCADHHAEIHWKYDEIIARDRATTRRPLSLYTWKQAETLMDKLEAACNRWLKKETPGIPQEKYEKQKDARRSRLNYKEFKRLVREGKI